MSCAPGIGNGGAGAQAHAGELLDHERKQGGLASVQVTRAGGVALTAVFAPRLMRR